MILLASNIDTMKRNIRIVIDAVKKVGLEVNTEIIYLCLVNRMQEKNDNVKIAKNILKV
jgi:hypothetical protein